MVFKDLTINPAQWCSVTQFFGTNTVVNLDLQGTNKITASNHSVFKGNATFNISAKCVSTSTFGAVYVTKVADDNVTLNQVGEYDITVGDNENASLNDAKSGTPLVITKAHNWELTSEVAPGCSDEGEKNYVCTVCGETKTEVVPATGNHVYESVVWNWTSDNKATATIHCSACDKDIVYNATVTEERHNLISDFTATVEIAGTTYTDTKSVSRTLNIVVGGVRISAANYSDILGDGTVSYDEATNTLTLNNATIEAKKYDSENECAIRINEKTSTVLNIELVGENRIINESTASGITTVFGIIGFDNDSGYRIFGSGSLDISFNADGEGITYTGIETRKATSIDGTSVSINIPGTSITYGYYMQYANKLTVKNGAALTIVTGSNEATYSMYSNRDNDNLSVEDTSVLEAVSDNYAFNSQNRITAATKALGAYVNTEPELAGASQWDKQTLLRTYKYIKILHIDEVPMATVTEVDNVPEGAAFAYKFVPSDTAESVDESMYASYHADFVATFNRDVKAGEIVFYGKYGDLEWTPVVLNRDVAAGEEYRIYSELMNDTLSYSTVCKNVYAENRGYNA